MVPEFVDKFTRKDKKPEDSAAKEQAGREMSEMLDAAVNKDET
jgi:hypothetical protein